MAWIESHQEILHHPKLDALADQLGINRMQAIGHLHALWWWAMDYAQDGDIGKYTNRQIARAVEWLDADPNAFVDALIDTGWLTADHKIHDWDQYGGKLLAKRQREAQRQANRRAVGSTPPPPSTNGNGPAAGHTRDVPRTSAQRTVADQIRLDQRREEQGGNFVDLPRAHAREAPRHAARDGDTSGSTRPLPVNPRLGEFERFWAAYPARHGLKLHRDKALAAYCRRVELGQAEMALQAVEIYTRSGDLAKDPHRWLDDDWRQWLSQQPTDPEDRPPERYGPDYAFLELTDLGREKRMELGLEEVYQANYADRLRTA